MYQKQMYLALVGVGVALVPVLIPLVPKMGTYIEAERVKAETQLQAQNLKASEQLKRDRIEERAKTSDALYQSGVMPAPRTIQFSNYLDDPKHEPRPNTNLIQRGEIADVFDAAGRCVGRIEGGKWKWKYYYQGLCEGVQNLSKKEFGSNGNRF